MIRAALIPVLLAAPAALAGSPPATVELNALEQGEGACRLSFTAQSPAGLEALVLEAVLFDTGGAVAELALFDFRDLPAGRMRVRQFDLPGLDCAAISRVLVNGMETCRPAAGGSCEGLPAVSSRTGVELLG
ncbi:hypothetical protein [Poseidonocella sp. HB161398]|uniref:hypothetical protein n=1 Tax=Poseidonocella sp. HB161398 TaxID=2320855 RepID=UPI001109BE43|nr:hypothetical protein [Poseidonocella sp. HB161398]